jgi:hypothetical protein
MDKDSSIDGLLKESEDFMFSSEDEQEEEGGKAKLPLLVRGKPKRGDGVSFCSLSRDTRIGYPLVLADATWWHDE